MHNLLLSFNLIHLWSFGIITRPAKRGNKTTLQEYCKTSTERRVWSSKHSSPHGSAVSSSVALVTCHQPKSKNIEWKTADIRVDDHETACRSEQPEEILCHTAPSHQDSPILDVHHLLSISTHRPHQGSMTQHHPADNPPSDVSERQ